jgi:cytochrome c nitrite reductase small subunit
MKPPGRPTTLLAAALGTAVGVGGYTFHYARGTSYLTDDPAACANCHVMRDFYDGWLKASHRSAATCNDCHTLPGFVGKFTTGWFPWPIQITARNRAVTEQACRKCHAEIVHAIDGPSAQSAPIECIRCHATVGHW